MGLSVEDRLANIEQRLRIPPPTTYESDPEFEAFPKIPRLFRECVITEKLDGTNAQVIVGEDGRVTAASRSRLITSANDNYGFAKWVEQNERELRELGPGRHFGEWWGEGIQRRYGLSEKRFSLFNVARWGEVRPQCCHVVPVLHRGMFSTTVIDAVLGALRNGGSQASPGFMNPEGIIVWHDAARQMFKVTLEKDEQPKGLAA